MAVELAELAAGLPVALSFALAGGMTSLREGRRRTALNEAMHELRRPLQVLSLAVPAEDPTAAAAGSSLRLATTALDRLDREINGMPRRDAAEAVEIVPLLEEAAIRWRPRGVTAGARLVTHLAATGIDVHGVRFELEQAVDNLINNAIEHGAAPVTIEAREEGDAVAILVRDSGAPGAVASRPRRRACRRTRRGHGLRVVRRIAADHGGSFELRRSGEGTEACLRLPLPGAGRR